MSNKKFSCTYIFAHGAGAGKDSEFMQTLSNLLRDSGVEVILFNFPYMQRMVAENKRRPPDRMPKLVEAFEAEIANILTTKNTEKKSVFIGGKSMGGRVASLIAASIGKKTKIKGLACLGFPFHPPKSPEKYRGDHLSEILIPTLILQGERDTFGSKEEVVGFDLPKSIELFYLPDGDHSFKPRVKSGYTMDDNFHETARVLLDFFERSR